MPCQLRLRNTKLGAKTHEKKEYHYFLSVYILPFTLLSDKDKEVLELYDVWKEKKKDTMGVVSTTYLIDKDGVIVAALDKVKAEENPGEMLGMLQ